MFARILLPLDMSPLAEQVLPVVRAIAAGCRSTVVLFHAVEPIQELLPISADVFEPAEQLEILRGRVLNYMQAVEADWLTPGLAVERRVCVGHPAESILETARCAEIDLIAMTTHGRSGFQRWARGSVAGKVLAHSTLPMLLVRAQAEPDVATPVLKRLLVPLDRSAYAEQALAVASELARTFDAELVLFHVWDYFAYRFGESGDRVIENIMRATFDFAKEYMVATTRRLQDAGLRARWQVQAGPIAPSIVNAAETDGADLIVMSSHGRSGLKRWALGSVADRVLCTSHKPVLLIRPPGASGYGADVPRAAV